MKKLLMVGFVCMLLTGTTSAENRFMVTMLPSNFDNPYEHSHPKDRELTWTPQVSLEDNLLSFDESESPIYIYVYKGDRMLYSQIVSDGCTSAELPKDLKGEFTLYMVYGDVAYYGEINL